MAIMSKQKNVKHGAEERKSGSKRTAATDIAGTPWAGMVKGMGLGEEMVKYTQFMKPTDEERQLRQTLRSIVQTSVADVYHGGATVKHFGPYSYDLAHFTSAVQLVIEDIDLSVMQALIHNLSLHPSITIGDVTEPNRFTLTATLASGEAATPLEASVTLTSCLPSHERATTHSMKGLIKRHPHAALTSFVLTGVLAACKVLTSGFTEETLLLLLAGYSAKVGGDSKDGPGEFMKGFMVYLGSFNEKEDVVDIGDGGVRKRRAEDGGDALVVVDPVSGGNAASGCSPHTFLRLKLTMKSMYSQMAAIEQTLGRQNPNAHGPRTVLSTVISYHEYWPRSFKMSRDLRKSKKKPAQKAGRSRKADRAAASSAGSSDATSTSSSSGSPSTVSLES